VRLGLALEHLLEVCRLSRQKFDREGRVANLLAEQAGMSLTQGNTQTMQGERTSRASAERAIRGTTSEWRGTTMKMKTTTMMKMMKSIRTKTMMTRHEGASIAVAVTVMAAGTGS